MVWHHDDQEEDLSVVIILSYTHSMDVENGSCYVGGNGYTSGINRRWFICVTDWFLEEKQILEEKAKVEGREGVEAPEASPIDIQSGVYPRSYFDLEKYPTHWKLVLPVTSGNE